MDAASLWVLVDANTRGIVFPEMHDIYIKEVVTGNELPLPGRLRKTAAASVSDFTVPYSYVDLNGHMNNARYYELAMDRMPEAELAMDRMPEAFRVRSLRELTSEHIGEAQLGDVLTVGCSSSEDSFSIYGEKDKPVFRMRFQFE